VQFDIFGPSGRGNRAGNLTSLPDIPTV